MAWQHKHFRLCREGCLGYHQRWYFRDFNVPLLPDALEKPVERISAEIVHRNHQRCLERVQHLNHPVEIERVGPVARHQHDIDPADLVELRLRQRVMEMAEMRDTQITDLEDENRIAVPFRAAIESADLG